jgi:hypothetical protein
VCGCADFVREAAEGRDIDNVIIADFTQLPREMSIGDLLAMTQVQRDAVERHVAKGVAAELIRRLPRDAASRKKLVESGQALVARMSWDRVLEQKLGPVVRRVMGERAPA